MPEISHHWVRLTDAELATILDFDPPSFEEFEEDAEAAYTTYLRWANRVAQYIEDGLETW